MDCCETSTQQREQHSKVCPQCGGNGRAVDIITLKALLTAEALKRLDVGPYRFCAEKNCDTVYYDETGTSFSRADLVVPVWQKSDDPSVYVCYCFEHSEASIAKEIAVTGSSTAVDEIRRLVQESKCACEVRNPQSSCCLGNVAKTQKRLESTAHLGVADRKLKHRIEEG